MLPDVDRRSHHLSATPSVTWKPALVPVLVIAAGGLLALFLWSVPSWDAFSHAISQFPSLWQVSGNQRAMLALVVKVCSPALMAIIIGGGFWLWSTIKPFLLGDVSTGWPTDPVRPLWPITTPTAAVKGQDRAVATSDLMQQSAHSTFSTPVVPPLAAAPLPSIPAGRSVRQDRQRLQKGKGERGPHGHATREKRSPHAEDLLLRRREHLSLVAGRTAHSHAEPTASSSPATRPTPASPTPANPSQQGAIRHRDTLAEAPSRSTPSPSYASLTLLKEVTLTLHAPGGASGIVPLKLNAKRVQLLAYIAWGRGEPVKRDKLLEQVFGHGRSDEEATPEKLSEAFDSHKKYLRGDIRKAAARLNAQGGGELIPASIDLFENKQQMWWLSSLCRVPDLEAVEAQHQVIEEARTNGLLVDMVPEEVKRACDALIAAYSGDFLEELIRDDLDAFEPWASSWARKPFTLYRDHYLQAVWYAAEYEWRAGQQHEDRRNEHWGRAAQWYRTYAMHACNSRFDTKVTFGTAGREHGERVGMSERALRRSIVLYGAVGSTHVVDQVYSAYSRHMRHMSSKVWEPSKDTLSDVQAAKEQTNEYRFLTQFAQQELN